MTSRDWVPLRLFMRMDGLEYDYKENGPIKVKVDIIKDLRIPQGSKAEIVKRLDG